MSNRRLIRKEGPLFITLKLEPKNSPSVTFLGRIGERKIKQNKQTYSVWWLVRSFPHLETVCRLTFWVLTSPVLCTPVPQQESCLKPGQKGYSLGITLWTTSASMWSHLGFVPVIRINCRLKNLLGSAKFPTLCNKCHLMVHLRHPVQSIFRFWFWDGGVL